MGVMTIVQLSIFFHKKHVGEDRFNKSYRSPFVHYTFLPYLLWLQSIAIALFITSTFKEFNGRLRPNFFAMCDYKGYRNAVANNNWTYYDANTIAGRPGDFKFCMATEGEVQEAMRSFPSGHSSLIFSALTPIAMYFLVAFTAEKERKFASEKLYEKLHWRKFKLKSWQIITTVTIFSTGLLIASTRTRDYFHNFDDVFTGSVIGIFSSMVAFYINYERSIGELAHLDSPREDAHLLTIAKD